MRDVLSQKHANFCTNEEHFAPTFVQELGTRVCFCDLLALALKDLRLDLRFEHKDLRLSRDLTLKTRDLLATCKSLCYSRVVINDKLGNISMWSGDFFCIM